MVFSPDVAYGFGWLVRVNWLTCRKHPLGCSSLNMPSSFLVLNLFFLKKYSFYVLSVCLVVGSHVFQASLVLALIDKMNMNF